VTAEFGDDEPEDAWHPDDPLTVLVRNLIRRRDRDIRDGRTVERDRMFDEDLAFVLARIALEAD
jgi:hypothetical protein